MILCCAVVWHLFNPKSICGPTDNISPTLLSINSCLFVQETTRFNCAWKPQAFQRWEAEAQQTWSPKDPFLPVQGTPSWGSYHISKRSEELSRQAWPLCLFLYLDHAFIVLTMLYIFLCLKWFFNVSHALMIATLGDPELGGKAPQTCFK